MRLRCTRATQSLLVVRRIHPQSRSHSRLLPAMTRQVELTEKEQTLRRLLLDVSEFIQSEKSLPKPQLRFTGGWVRDKLLGTGSKDIDIGIDSMTGEQFGLYMKEYMDEPSRSSKYGKDVVHKISKIAANPEKSKHLETATTQVLGLDIDLVNLRKETYAEDSRNPQIESATPEEDALRRDSTVNALFYNLQTGEVEDFTGLGLQDMEKRIIRTPLEPYQTFKDDPLRVLRTIRFASRLGYAIDSQALECMKDKTIQEALRAKISRERVGGEVLKMLKGPDPLRALQLIDQQSLYNIIFTDPIHPDVLPPGRQDWSKAYTALEELLHGDPDQHTAVIRRLLFTQSDGVHNAWVLAALSPWMTMYLPQGTEDKPKPLLPAASVAAREGMKTDNKTMLLLKHAVDCHAEIVAIKTTLSSEADSTTSAGKRKQKICGREGLGMAIRRWGPDWRSSVLYAILLGAMKQDLEAVLPAYSSLLLELERLELLEAYALKPLVDGKRLAKALRREPGPWMAPALTLVMEWQLRNPKSDDSEAAVEEVREKLRA